MDVTAGDTIGGDDRSKVWMPLGGLGAIAPGPSLIPLKGDHLGPPNLAFSVHRVDSSSWPSSGDGAPRSSRQR